MPSKSCDHLMPSNKSRPIPLPPICQPSHPPTSNYRTRAPTKYSQKLSNLSQSSPCQGAMGVSGVSSCLTVKRLGQVYQKKLLGEPNPTYILQIPNSSLTSFFSDISVESLTSIFNYLATAVLTVRYTTERYTDTNQCQAVILFCNLFLSGRGQVGHEGR